MIYNNKNDLFKKYDERLRKSYYIISKFKSYKKGHEVDKKEVSNIIKLIKEIILFSENNTTLVID